ncbi:hypothetical protein RHAL1_03211 [Beijerinckiaceae bacterium RH AL1]|nr:DUF2721 domain-containing protein [Beijerinckiaceae bacterium]VVB48220.1 hypothetical protein RHCH11_RHCH11_03146 [Beijerinckiaceae bacterium RH CH11]VVB48300.1 hypothetical protein RHAL8_03142 [Beijerinckiaceae bacterium RH AL8]VVC56284.1 hypothetical protein RHAL1_03211 [Beijerinckiaceae bacterium RH AL1]
MSIDLANIFKAVGPAASVIFAAWIFMAFLQTRYDAAVDRYRSLVEQYRCGDQRDTRRVNLRDSILVYKKRCEIMNIASVIGLASAVLLISSLIIGELSLALPSIDVLKIVCICGTLAGLALVIAATAIVIYESLIIHRQLEAELLDLPELAHGMGAQPGAIGDEGRAQASASKVLPR